ncbi:OTU domain-containing protein 7B-like isoform X2 [Ischnura elegans]|uniref:OTU domain-containing protein 7B-like isoform X2 n=1 Tax=Ischnura elegans TaxID=197161 RepID=UPI001ED8AA6E|nr:OTU domain-containing protein 7B-like isoform X2 [Ischnura elegans]
MIKAERNYYSDRWGMEANLVAEFVSKTGVDTAVAEELLRAKGWDMGLALKAHSLFSCPPTSFYQQNRASPFVGSSPSALGGVPSDWPVSTVSTVPLNHTESSSMAKEDESKKLSRGISRATDNVTLVSRARNEFAMDFKENSVCNLNQYFIETPIFTFTLPDLSIYPDDFREYLEKDLIEISSLASLEQAGRLNWWAGTCQRLWPLATTGDGNCLLHAASLGMWGFHDRLLTLRKALHAFMSGSECKEAIWRRWRWQQTRLNAEAGFVYGEEEWAKEWDAVVNMASTAPRSHASRRRSTALDSVTKHLDESWENATYESLEEIHVLALAHVLRRPIIVIADLMLKDVNGEALAPIPFGGIYLPFECSPAECHCSPLVLTYDAAHFSALVVMDKETYADGVPRPPAVIPITDADHELLPIQFSIDPGELLYKNQDENDLEAMQRLTLSPEEKLLLLREYLDVIKIPMKLPNNGDNSELDVIETDVNIIPYEEDTIDKRFSEVDLDNDESILNSSEGVAVSNRSKAAKQLQSVAKQFGSIGKSMSKKFKKNFGSITKIARNNSLKKKYSANQTSPLHQPPKVNGSLVSQSPEYILGAVLHTDKRHEYQEEMIRNYLQSARMRFEKDKELKSRQVEEKKLKDDWNVKDSAEMEVPSMCINAGCGLYGTSLTSYMCTVCYQKQKEREAEMSKSPNINSPLMNRANELAPRYGTGKSKFYAEADCCSHNTVGKLPLSRAGSNIDHTLYLSKSTFYNDIACPPGIPEMYQEPRRKIIECQSQPSGIVRDIVERENISNDATSRDLPVEKESMLQSEIQTPDPCSTLVPLSGAPSKNISKVFIGGVSNPEESRWGDDSLSYMPYESSPRVVSCGRAAKCDTTNIRISGGIQLPISGAQQCRSLNCRFFGNSDTNFYCSKCYNNMPVCGSMSTRTSDI